MAKLIICEKNAEGSWQWAMGVLDGPPDHLKIETEVDYWNADTDMFYEEGYNLDDDFKETEEDNLEDDDFWQMVEDEDWTALGEGVVDYMQFATKNTLGSIVAFAALLMSQ